MTKTITRWRSSKTGRLVKESYGKKHKSTTEKERLKIRKK